MNSVILALKGIIKSKETFLEMLEQEYNKGNTSYYLANLLEKEAAEDLIRECRAAIQTLTDNPRQFEVNYKHEPKYVNPHAVKPPLEVKLADFKAEIPELRELASKMELQ